MLIFIVVNWYSLIIAMILIPHQAIIIIIFQDLFCTLLLLCLLICREDLSDSNFNINEWMKASSLFATNTIITFLLRAAKALLAAILLIYSYSSSFFVYCGDRKWLPLHPLSLIIFICTIFSLIFSESFYHEILWL